MSTEWTNDLIELAVWSLNAQDLKYKYLYADKPDKVLKTPGIVWVLETAAVLGIYEAAIGKGYKECETIEHEKPYPGEDGKNPRRADLAIKEKGPGKNWAYIEIKYYGPNGRSQVAADIEKLRSIERRSQRWMLIYRVRAIKGRA